MYPYIETTIFQNLFRGAKMSADESIYTKFRRFLLIMNIFIVALINGMSTILAFRTCLDSCVGFNDFLLIGLALSIPGWAFLIMYGFGCYDSKDWRRTLSAVLASLQIIIFLLLPIIYSIDYFYS